MKVELKSKQTKKRNNEKNSRILSFLIISRFRKFKQTILQVIYCFFVELSKFKYLITIKSNRFE